MAKCCFTAFSALVLLHRFLNLTDNIKVLFTFIIFMSKNTQILSYFSLNVKIDFK